MTRFGLHIAAMTQRIALPPGPISRYAALCAAILAVIGLSGAAKPPPLDPFADVTSWTYQLQSLDLDRLQREAGDMLVIDFSQSTGENRPMRILTRADVDKLKRKPDGSRRLVIAYLSIGEAEEYRYYWRPEWKDAPPDWYVAENCRWPRNHVVRYWLDGWKEIMIRGPQSYLGRIREAGFDGVYLDRIDAYADLAAAEPRARTLMVDFVKELAREARGIEPRLLVVAQNAEELLSEATYRAAIDALAKEDLLFGVRGTGERNPAAMIEGSMDLLKQLQRDGKRVFSVEYLRSASQMEAARAELTGVSILPVFPARALDGTDPLASSSDERYGTPEYAAANCDGILKKAALGD